MQNQESLRNIIFYTKHLLYLSVLGIYRDDDMRTYIYIIFNSDMNPAEFAKDMTELRMQMLFGPHDFVIEWDTYEEFHKKFKRVLPIIKKYKLNYRLQTFEESEEDLPFMSVAMTK